VIDMKTIDHLDAFTAPRLVEYFDPDSCAPAVLASTRMAFSAAAPAAVPAPPPPVRAYKGVTVEATYDVAEYDVSILSANESDGLVDFLRDNGYRLPDGAEAVLGSYIKQKMHFFIAKVNLARMELSGRRFLRPLQVRYETAKFMLPLRLGTLNANGPQDLIVLALTRKGPGRDHELPDQEAADRHGSAALRQGQLRAVLPGDVRPRRRPRRYAHGVP